MSPVLRISVLALGVWTGALAQQPPPAPTAAASSVQKATAPTSPTTRLLQDARPSGDEGRENVATPQVAIPLKRTASRPVALKPGRPERTRGSVDETAARCGAERASGVQAECAAR